MRRTILISVAVPDAVFVGGEMNIRNDIRENLHYHEYKQNFYHYIKGVIPDNYMVDTFPIVLLSG